MVPERHPAAILPVPALVEPAATGIVPCVCESSGQAGGVVGWAEIGHLPIVRALLSAVLLAVLAGCGPAGDDGPDRPLRPDAAGADAGGLDQGAADLGRSDGGDSGSVDASADAGDAEDGGGPDFGPMDGGNSDLGSEFDGGSDGGTVAMDAGPSDLGFDAGPSDLGPDAGDSDGGGLDAADGGGLDAADGGLDAADGGGLDLGASDGGPDAGAGDGGAPDLGPFDADPGPADLGVWDAGSDVDSGAGTGDLGALDAGLDGGGPDIGFDGGGDDAGAADGGGLDTGPIDSGAADGGGFDAADAGGLDGALPDATSMDGGPSDGSTADGGFVATGPTPCTADGWCWDNPYPQYGDFRGVWTDGSEAWLVGANGLALRFDGQDWRRVPSGTTNELAAVWGADADDVWIVGRSDLLRWDGAALSSVASPIASPNSSSVHGSARTNVWIGGTRALHWDGTMLRHDTAAVGLNDVFVAGATLAVGVGNAGRVLEWDGQSWTLVPTPAARSLYAVHGAGGEIWAAGDRGEVFVRDGAGWRIGPGVPSASRLSTLWMSGPQNVYASGSLAGALLRWDGAAWSVPYTVGGRPVAVDDIFGSRTADVLATGGTARFASYDGTGWVDSNRQNTLRAVVETATGARTLWAGGLGGILMRRDLGMWTPVSLSSVGTRGILGSYAGAGETWLVGEGGLALRHANGSWTPVLGTSRDLHGAWGSGPNALWVVGDGLAPLSWDGSTLRTRPGPSFAGRYRAIWGAAPNDVFAVGLNALVSRYDGTSWTPGQVGPRSRAYEAIDGTGPTNVWIAGHEPRASGGQGRDGVVLRFDGATWQVMGQFPLRVLTGIYVASSSEVWVTTEDGEVLRYDGQVWIAEDLVGSIDMHAIGADHQGRLWMVGRAGSVLYRDRTSSAPMIP